MCIRDSAGATAKITINNRRLNRVNFEKNILMPLRGDTRDIYRREYNRMLLDKAMEGNGIIQEKYITVTVLKKDIEEARSYFARTGADLCSHFAALGAKCTELDVTERLRVLHDFYRVGEEVDFHFNAKDMMQKDVYKRQEFLYLGGNEQSTHEYVSKLLGKETIDTNTYGQSKGRNGSYSTNWQLAGRELMTPDEVRMLDNRYALLFIRGERPVEDLKFDILKHSNIALTTDGGAEPYWHGEDSISIAALSIDEGLLKKAGAEPVSEDEYLFFCEEELEELLQKKMEEKQHEQENQEQD